MRRPVEIATSLRMMFIAIHGDEQKLLNTGCCIQIYPRKSKSTFLYGQGNREVINDFDQRAMGRHGCFGFT